MSKYMPNTFSEWLLVAITVIAIITAACSTITRNPDGSVTTQQMDPAAAQALVILLPELIDMMKDDPDKVEEADSLAWKLMQARALLQAAGIYEIYTPNGTVIRLDAPPIDRAPWEDVPNG